MDVLRLNRDTFRVDKLIEGHDSLIWTERYRELGEFELKTPLINQYLEALPTDSLISLRDTDEVMFVETHKIEEDEEGTKELVITGRTFESVFERRVFKGFGAYNGGKPTKIPTNLQGHGSAALLAYNFLTNDLGTDVLDPTFGKGLEELVNNVVITDSVVGSTSASKKRVVPRGAIHPTIITYLTQAKSGIRTIRPVLPGGTSGRVVTILPFADPSPEIVRTDTDGILDLRVDFYRGTDRTIGQTDVAAVVFDYFAGHIVKPAYLFSIRDHRNNLYADTDGFLEKEYPPLGDPSYPEGLDLRMAYESMGDKPDGFSNAEWEDALDDRKDNLFDTTYSEIAIVDAQVSEQIPYKYKVDFGLGDWVTLRAEYGVEQTMQVTEYIRTEDAEGERGYPTLVRVP